MKKKILVIEDDPGIRRSLALTLKTEGHDVLEAADGRAGLALAGEELPALIICDVNMPGMDGYEVVAAVRKIPALTSTPFVFLTARGERSEIRRGMNLGADDYLTKPFTREELIESVRVRLKKHDESREALTQLLILDSERLRSRFVGRLTSQAPHAAIDDPRPDGANRVIEATVLFTDIRSFTTLSERLSVVEIAAVLNKYFQRACEPVLAAGGRVVKFIGDGIMAVFPHGEEGRERQALHAIQAGLALSVVAHEFRQWMHGAFPDRGLPEFAIGVGIHTGEVTLFGAPGEDTFTVIGDTVNIASRLEGQTKELGWPVVASGAAISAAGEAVLHGAHRVVHLRGRVQPVLVYEVTGLKGLAAPSRAAPPGEDLTRQLQQALLGNAEGAALAAKAALRDTLLGLLSNATQPSLSAPLRLKNYAVIAKLVERESSALYLAERDSDGKNVAVRIRRKSQGNEGVFERFVRQATTVGRIQHPNIARIFDHGFADDVAYIVTEYFPRGSVKQSHTLPLPSQKALHILSQMVRGLVEVHRVCNLAEDIQPEHVMVRESGEVALSELDCAGEIGTPAEGRVALDALHYRAPERIRGQPGDQRSDVYSAGAIFYELVTGHPPYVGNSTEHLKQQILSAPVPSLPAHQPLIDRMLAKSPAERFPTALALLDALK